MLIKIPQLLSPDDAAQIGELLDKSIWTDGKQTAGSLGKSKKHNLQSQQGTPSYKVLNRAIMEVLKRNRLFNAAALPARISPPQFNKYDCGMEYGDHVDSALQKWPSFSMRTDLSATIFLADPTTYEGGELVINDSFGNHSVKLAMGDMVLYSASSRHHVLPVVSGCRIASFFWIQSMIRDDSAREIIFELKQFIDNKLAKSAEAEELLPLVSVYENLLRRWVNA